MDDEYLMAASVGNFSLRKTALEGKRGVERIPGQPMMYYTTMSVKGRPKHWYDEDTRNTIRRTRSGQSVKMA